MTLKYWLSLLVALTLAGCASQGTTPGTESSTTYETYEQGTIAREAEAFFGKGAERDPLCRVFLARCQTLMKDPPNPDWDGVWALERRELVRT